MSTGIDRRGFHDSHSRGPMAILRSRDRNWRDSLIRASGRSLPNPASAFLAERVRAFLRNLPRSFAGEDEAIHDLRVSGRRLRVVIPLVARPGKRRRVRRLLRGLRRVIRAAATSRDLDVALALFGETVVARDPASVEVHRRLRNARRRAHRRMTQAFLAVDLSRVRAGLEEVLARGTEEPFAVLLRLGQAKEREGETLVSNLQALGERFDPLALHRLRRRVRRLRYMAELGEAHLSGSAGAAKEFKRVQEILGEMHDAWVLAEWLRDQGRRWERRGAPLLVRAAARYARAFRRRARESHGRFLGMGPQALLRWALDRVGRNVSAA